MKKLSVLAFAVAAFCGSAQASVIKVETANATSSPLASAQAYLDAVNAALQGSSYASRLIDSYDAVSHQALFGGNSDFALKSTIEFTLERYTYLAIRAGVDFGLGGAMFVDGVAVDFKSTNMWWGGSYTNPSQYFRFAKAFDEGKHTLTIVGFENCCDGNQQVQFRRDEANWASFTSNDKMTGSDVPEPASIALLLTGVGLIGATRRRKAAPQA